jgi:hypothetical protein
VVLLVASVVLLLAALPLLTARTVVAPRVVHPRVVPPKVVPRVAPKEDVLAALLAALLLPVSTLQLLISTALSCLRIPFVPRIATDKPESGSVVKESIVALVT